MKAWPSRPGNRAAMGLLRDIRDAVLGRPEVILEVVLNEGMLIAAIRNIGSRPAHDITIECAPPLPGPPGMPPLSDRALFRDLAFLAPGGDIRTLLGYLPAWREAQAPMQVRVVIRYRNGRGHRYTTRLRHNFDALAGALAGPAIDRVIPPSPPSGDTL